MNKITPITAFKDNYIWAIHSLEGSTLIVVDPGDATPVLEYIQKTQFKIEAILLTHHHHDHSGGIASLRQAYPAIKVYGSDKQKVPAVTDEIKEDAEIHFPDFDLNFKVLAIPGHTLDHVAYVAKDLLFCGDTLFSCGCGRVFEGTPEQMVHSLAKLQKLPENTRIYCGHEYTLANIAFAELIEPHNTDLAQRKLTATHQREKKLPTLPALLKEELKTNPFLRCTNAAVIQAVQTHSKSQLNDPVEIFAYLRAWKNQL